MERTRLEIARAERIAAFRRTRVSRARLKVRYADVLLDLVEQCRLNDWALVPTPVWSAVVRTVRAVDPDLRDELGINRSPEHVADVLFMAQETLLARLRDQRQPVRARIIPLFSDAPRAATG
jgi:hypothetical protein